MIEPVVPDNLKDLSHAKRLEKVAALLVGELTDTTLVELDPGGGGVQLADFEIRDETDRRVGVLEVTTSTRSERARFGARVRKRDWKLPGLMWSWSLHTTDESDPARLNEEVGPILVAMEQKGPPEDWLPAMPGLVDPEPGALPTELVELGVCQAVAWHRHSIPDEAWVSVQIRIPGGIYSSQTALTGEVQAELDKADNQAKLRGQIGRSELFIWLDIGLGAAAATTLSGPVWSETLDAVALPQFPDGITAVWAATGMADWPRPATSLLRCDGSRWETIGRPILTFGRQES